MGKRQVTVAAVQMQCTNHPQENLKKAEKMVRQAAAAGAQIILLSELFEREYFCQQRRYDFYSYAKPVEENEAVRLGRKLAKELKVVLPISFYEKEVNNLYNSVACIDADGEILGVYRKTHIPDDHYYQEKFYFTPGDTGFRVFDTRYGKIGVGICWDQWFPETARCMALEGAELLFYPTAIGSEPILACDSMPHWRRCMQGHAAMNLMPVIAANRIGKEEVKPCAENGGQESSLIFYGSSFITDETGELLQTASRDQEEILTETFDLGVQQYPSESSGSGIIVGQNDSEILVATNNHVVADADTITVAFDDDAVYEAQVKGTDSDNDLAVVAVKISDMSEDTLKSIKVVSIGNSDELEIGEQVVAIGNALGYGQSVTSGWISAVDREVTDEDGKTTGKLIQTDAAINPGNSGGALLNMQGELIGINSAKAAATEVEGMGYAIPVSVAQPILDELMNRETRYKADEDHAGYIGVTCLNVDSTSAQTYGIPLGAFVDSVEEGGPAQTAGIQKGDVIVKFDGMTVSGSSDLVGKLEYYQAGETVEVVISRAQNGEYQEQTVSVTLGKKSEMKQADPQQGK